MDNSNHLLHIHTGDGGSSDNGSGSSGGRGGGCTPIGDAPPKVGLYICLRYRTLEFRVEFVPRLFLFVIRIHHQAQDRGIHSSVERP
ncbi:hypothetical protein BS47DRAFT_1354123 [Hydnum rufescens UP504]|uniref:Uncharacterized protein n=1 Tax=Hydnum rufescens UP504 TaxID=1448309 RepID=A0A9P6AGE1_9AGAM|nr:hypothetical protein BS47DRAFT_1354123 [Hydnum rufescens UP504]